MKRLALILILTMAFTTPVFANTKVNYDEYRIYSSSQNKAVKVTNTDDLHIYSNKYGQKKKYTKFSYDDEFHTVPTDIEANDGYKAGNFDELHINENYRQNVWQPEEEVNRINGFDEFHLPNEL